MLDRNAVASYIAEILHDNEDLPTCRISTDVLRDALALIREQEPVKPKRALGVLPDWYHCGVCGVDMLDTGDGYRLKYCPQCGRAVKWDD